MIDVRTPHGEVAERGMGPITNTVSLLRRTEVGLQCDQAKKQRMAAYNCWKASHMFEERWRAHNSSSSASAEQQQAEALTKRRTAERGTRTVLSVIAE